MMRVVTVVAVAGLLISGLSAFGQTGADSSGQTASDQNPPAPSGGLHAEKPHGEKMMDSLEERDKEIRKYNPADPGNLLLPEPDRDGPAATAAQAPPRPFDQAAPLPGSVAASNLRPVSNPRSQGPQVISEDAPTSPEYTGPAVLSRSYTISRPMTREQVKWAPTFGLSVSRDNGLTGGTVRPDGSLANQTSYGQSATWAFSGRHFWRHDVLGLDYTGNYNRYSSNNSYSGFNQSMNADFSHLFSPHLSLHVVTSGSIYSQSYSLENPAATPGASIANVSLATSPTVQILDQGTRQFNTLASLTWQKSARLSFSYSGGFFVVDHSGTGLFGTTGYQAQADVNYRYTRKTTVGLYYSFTDYGFTHRIQLANSQTFGAIYSYALSRSMQFRLRGGVSRTESEGLTTVAIDPVIALLIGRGSTIVDTYHLSATSDVSAEIVKDFGRNRTASISYAHGIAPGNGLLMTSVQESVGAAFSTRVFHSCLLNFSGGRNTLSSVSQTVGKYDTTFAGFSVSRHLTRGVSTNFEVDYRKFSLSGQPLSTEATLHNQLRISSGITWGPGENRLW